MELGGDNKRLMSAYGAWEVAVEAFHLKVARVIRGEAVDAASIEQDRAQIARLFATFLAATKRALHQEPEKVSEVMREPIGR